MSEREAAWGTASLRRLDRELESRGIDRATASVLALVAVGLLARLVFLGARVAHFDEARVGYWILHGMETGEFHYRFIIHGPFLQHVNSIVFPALGANDYTLRIGVALIGAALPLPLLLLREHLEDIEIVAAAAFLTLNPVLLYYSRFFRSTIPVAAFCFGAFACWVRYYDSRRPLFAHAGVVLLALGFTAKESAAIYLLVFLGAGALLLDAELFRPRKAPSGVAWIGDWMNRNVRGRDLQASGRRFVGHALLAGGLFSAIILFFYAPRAGTPGGVGLYQAFTDPGLFPSVIEATLADMEQGFRYWFGQSGETGVATERGVFDQYRNFLERSASVLTGYAGPLVGFAVLGMIVERYGAAESRNLVLFASYWGIASVVGYPLGADIFGPWITVNMLVPLAIPAGVGVALLYRWGQDAYADNDDLSVGIIAIVALLVVLQVLGTGVASVYVNPQGENNKLVQFGQPADDIRPTMQDVGTLAAANEGPDVLFFNQSLVSYRDEPMEPECAYLTNTLPLQWYMKRYDVTGTCAADKAALEAEIDSNPPPVVIALAPDADQVASRLPDSYERRYLLIHKKTPTTVARVFFIDRDRLAAASDGPVGARHELPRPPADGVPAPA